MGLPLLIHPDILFGFDIENAITKTIYPITKLLTLHSQLRSYVLV